MSGPANEGPVERGGREDRLLFWDEVEHMASISRTTAWRMEREGTFPSRVRVSPGRVGWWESELTSWKRTRSSKLLPPGLRSPRAPRLPTLARPLPTLTPAPPPPTEPNVGEPAPVPEPGAGARQTLVRTRRSRPRVAPDQIDFGF